MNDPTPATALAEELDKKLLVILRDGRKLVGILRSFDQFANLVLQEAVERIIVGQAFSDIPLGLYIVRGENVVLLGQVDVDYDTPRGLNRVTNSAIKQAQKAERNSERESQRLLGSLSRMHDFLESFE